MTYKKKREGQGTKQIAKGREWLKAVWKNYDKYHYWNLATMGEEKRSWFDYCTAVTEVRQKYTHETMSESVTECKCRSLQLITQRMSKSRKLTTHNPEVTPSCVTQCHLWIGKWVKKRFSLLAHSSSSFILALEKHSCINWHIHTHIDVQYVCTYWFLLFIHARKNKYIY